MASLAVTLRGRHAAESLMRDVCVVRRKTGESVDEVSFEVTPTYDTIYTGRVKMQTYEGHETERESAGQTVVQQRSSAHFPVGALHVVPGDIVTVVAAFDPLLVGRSWRIVQEYPVKTFMTAYRVFVDENIGERVPPLPEIEEAP